MLDCVDSNVASAGLGEYAGGGTRLDWTTSEDSYTTPTTPILRLSSAATVSLPPLSWLRRPFRADLEHPVLTPVLLLLLAGQEAL